MVSRKEGGFGVQVFSAVIAEAPAFAGTTDYASLIHPGEPPPYRDATPRVGGIGARSLAEGVIRRVIRSNAKLRKQNAPHEAGRSVAAAGTVSSR